MKKVLFVLLAVVIMASTLVVSTSAVEIPTDGLLAHFKFEGNFVNEVNGEAATQYMDNWQEGMYEGDVEGMYWVHNSVDGYGLDLNEGEGFSTGVSVNGKDFTVAVWLLEGTDPGIVPYVWYGGYTQSTENWIGIWNVDITSGWTRPGVTVGSNDAAGARLEIVPTEGTYDADAAAEGGLLMQWTHIAIAATYVADTDTYDIVMYVNGVEAGSNTGFPNPGSDDPETNGDYFYVNGVNYWSDPNSTGAMDDLLIYEKALSADEIASIYGSYEAPKEYASQDEFYEDCQVIESGDSGEDTEAPDDTEANDTEANDTEANDTEANDTKAPESTAAPEEEKGCGSAMGAAAAIVALTSVLGCAIVKKH